MTPAPAAPTPAGLRRYRLCGVTVDSAVEFRTPLVAATGAGLDGPADLIYTCGPGRGLSGVGAPIFESDILLEDGRPRLSLHRMTGSDGGTTVDGTAAGGDEPDDGSVVLRFTDVADYEIEPDAIRAQLIDPELAHMVEMHVLGLVLALWFALRGTLVLHGSAVGDGDRSVAFLATNRGGKTSLAASFMERGWSLLSDDMVVLGPDDGVGPAVQPSFPQMRMWPDLARVFHGDRVDRFEIFHPRYDKLRVPVSVSGSGHDGPGGFAVEPQPLAALVLPDRRPAGAVGSPRLEPLGGGEAMMGVIDNVFGVASVEALGLQRRRLPMLAALVAAVPVLRLIYEDGYDRLPDVTALIADRVGVERR